MHGESVPNITNWQRGAESLVMLTPRVHNMPLLGLGNSIGMFSVCACVISVCVCGVC